MAKIDPNPPDGTRPVNAHLVLVEPSIPGNTGSLARLCAGTHVVLHLVEPLGFQMDHRQVKRAGLDYWPNVMWQIHPNLDHALRDVPREQIFLFTAHAQHRYTQVDYRPTPWLVFGTESTGFNDEIKEAYSDRLVRVPITSDIRSLNLANVASIAAYEALRQLGFPAID